MCVSPWKFSTQQFLDEVRSYEREKVPNNKINKIKAPLQPSAEAAENNYTILHVLPIATKVFLLHFLYLVQSTTSSMSASPPSQGKLELPLPLDPVVSVVVE